jgi:sulfite reductase (NADPH) flavoprotein alpha-component
MSCVAPMLPATAPFTDGQRAWLNGWLAAYYADGASPVAAPAVPAVVTSEEDFPWHDMALSLDERMALAGGRPLSHRLMAAMAQQDCGQCGYLCATYAQAIASGAETALNRCVPGGKATARMVKELMEVGSAPAAIIAASAAPAPAEPSARRNALARLRDAIPLNRAGSAKDTRQIILDLAGTGLTYQPGDALGIHAANCSATVAAIIARLGADPDKEFEGPDGIRRTLRDNLLTACDIGGVSDEAVEVLASRAVNISESQRLQALAEGYPGASPENADLLELLETFPSARPPLQELISALSPLQPRLYSISSSPKFATDAVHLTVAAVRYELRGRRRSGVASTFLAERARPGAGVKIFVQEAHGFRMPTDPVAPMIMIGPGTGIAPFRAFLQERRAVGATGRNWLFFGDQRRASDFLYEDELTAFHRDGLLHRLDLAFSRDQPERIYVQQRMREQAKELWRWLEDGAHLYVCGSVAMGKDVDAALAAIIARQTGKSIGAAKAYLADLTRADRYRRDVY